MRISLCWCSLGVGIFCVFCVRRAADENIHENIRLLGRLLCSHHKGHTLPFHVSQPFTVVVEYYNDYGDNESSLMTAMTWHDNGDCDDDDDDCDDNSDDCNDDGGHDWPALIAKVTRCPFASLCLSLFPLIENILRCQRCLVWSFLFSFQNLYCSANLKCRRQK